jgi:L-Ala-D/L-Glu epimerase
MIVENFTFAGYDIPFRTPLKTARGELKSRRGFLVAAHGKEGGVGVGEIATLPEFGTESYRAAESILQGLPRDILRSGFFPDITDFARYYPSPEFQRFLKSASHPAVTFGISCALLGLMRALEDIQHQHSSAFIDCTTPFPVNSLVPGSSVDEIFDVAQQRCAVGFRTLKLKVGVLPIEEELRAIRRIRVALPEVKLRLDANRAWTRTEAIDFCTKVKSMEIEYIEDPTSNTDALQALRARCGIPVAIDELWTPEYILSGEADWTLCDVLVLKPVRIGSYMLIKKIQSAAQSHGVRTVYTTMIDTSVGIACTLGMMREFADHTIAHGLDTARLLASDTLTHPIIPDQGMLRVPDLASLPSLIREPYRTALGLPS